ncbi:hypothetical protein BGW39_011686 [Mortierella sp. 14UC]|nr:hypothetical protein BGW39_011686 [Mortierella sp. 14UC]
MPTGETTTDVKASPKAAIPHKDDVHDNNHKDLFSANSLAPEIILIILSFLDASNNPTRLAPILTLCKSWARLALELIYEQPVLTLKSLPNFIATLELQDRLHNGQTPFWETNIHLDGGRKSLGIEYRSLIKKPCRIVGAVAPTRQSLVLLWDLQALLWTVPALAAGPVPMMESPVLASSCPNSSPPQSPLSPPLTPSTLVQSSPTSPTLAAPTPVPSTTSTAFLSLSSSQRPPLSRSSSSSSPSPSKAVLLRRKKKTLPPPGPVVMLLESTATFSEILHDVLREVPGMKLRHLNYRLIPGLPLSGVLRNHLSTLRELIVSRSPARLDEYMAIARLLSGNTGNSNGSGDDDTSDSSQQQQQSQIHTLALDRCQGAGMTALTELVRACGSHLRTLEFRQHTMIRPAVGGGGGAGGADLAHFPTDIPDGWNAQETAQEDFAREMAESPSLSTCEPGQACRKCGSFVNIDHGKAPQEISIKDQLETVIDGLSIESAATLTTTDDGAATSTTSSIPTATTQEQQAPQPQQQQQQQQEGVGIPAVGVDPETRMDLAMHTVSELCPRLTRLYLQNMTWLSDNSLSGFRPTYLHQDQQHQQQQHQQHRGLKGIELLDSHYASQVTIEGLLELCGPNLETLVVDRKSCWRTRICVSREAGSGDSGAPIQPSGTRSPATLAMDMERGLCAGCVDKERLRRFRDETMSTGDRIISGLLLSNNKTASKETRGLLKQDPCSIQQTAAMDDSEKKKKEEVGRSQGRVRRLCTLMLIEHWVSVQVFKEALCRWSRTLAVVSLRLYKCSNQELEDALMPRNFASPAAITATTALERLELSLPWIAPTETEEQLGGLVDRVFEAHTSLTFVEINRRSWRRKATAMNA